MHLQGRQKLSAAFSVSADNVEGAKEHHSTCLENTPTKFRKIDFSSERHAPSICAIKCQDFVLATLKQLHGSMNSL